MLNPREDESGTLQEDDSLIVIAYDQPAPDQLDGSTGSGEGDVRTGPAST